MSHLFTNHNFISKVEFLLRLFWANYDLYHWYKNHYLNRRNW